MGIKKAAQKASLRRVWFFDLSHAIDIIAVFATLFGLTTSLGLGAQQATAGMSYVYGTPDTLTVQIIVIICVTAIALISVVRGLDGGVKLLSNVNMAFAFLLLAAIFLFGPTVRIVSDFFTGLYTYATDVIPLSMPFGREDDSYRQGWTSFYWSWWISWSPFVGMFIARVSRGRTVREFVTCVILIPSLVSVFWMAVFGGAAIDQVIRMGQESGVYENVIANYDASIAMFAMLEELPFTNILSTLGIILVLVFFITSSDSGSLVIDTITARGKTEAPTAQRIFWCTTEGVVAIALLLGGSLTALQAMVNATGIFFTVVLLLLCWSLWEGLRTEPKQG